MKEGKESSFRAVYVSMKLSLNTKYQMSNIFFFGLFAAMMAFVSNYLLSLGYSNSVIGIVLSVYSILSVFGQPVLADYAENHPQTPLRVIIGWAVLGVMGLSILLYFSGLLMGQNILVLVLITAVFTLANIVMPLFNALAFIYEKYGITINYGVARGLGSAAYAVVSMALGYIVNWLSPSIIPLCYAFFALLTFLVIRTYVLPGHETEQRESHAPKKETKEGKGSFFGFVKKYPRYILFLFGFMLVYSIHMLINSFYIQVITGVGGNSSDMGIAVFIAAMVELPAMFGFSWLNKKFGTANLLRLSIVFFVIKHTITFLATNMAMIYAAALIQALAYAVFMPASVYYVNEIVGSDDLLMGQSVNVMFTTLGGVVSGLVGGSLLDLLGVSGSLLVGAVLSAVGCVIVLLTVQKPRKKLSAANQEAVPGNQ